jgi:hypothetical protein
MKLTKPMQAVFNALYDRGYMLQKRKEDTFWLIIISESKSVYKREIFDNGNDCICIGSYNQSYDYQRDINEMVDMVINHVEHI